VLTLLSKPLFWLLEHAHCVRAATGASRSSSSPSCSSSLFYPLSEKAGRSMARMRALAPRMKRCRKSTRTTARSSARKRWSCTSGRR
jgi:hypothetical protein